VKRTTCADGASSRLFHGVGNPVVKRDFPRHSVSDHRNDIDSMAGQMAGVHGFGGTAPDKVPLPGQGSHTFGDLKRLARDFGCAQDNPNKIRVYALKSVKARLGEFHGAISSKWERP
jgi:hypothetical protein